MNQKPSSDELENLGLILICKNCGSANIKELEDETSESKDMCGDCGTIDYTTTIPEKNFVALQPKDDEG